MNRGTLVDSNSLCRCCTPLTRLYLILAETRTPYVTLLQRTLCTVFSAKDIDAIALTKTPSYEEMDNIVYCLRALARGALVASHTLGILLANSCDDLDEDATRIGSVDTLVFSEGRLKCRLLYPRVLASCIPRGYEALVAVRWPWQAKLLLAALAQAGYTRVHVTGEQIDLRILSISNVYRVELNVVPLDTAHYYLENVDVTLDTGLLQAGAPGKILRLSWDEPTELTPCITSQWLSRAILLWENIFIEPGELKAIVASHLHNKLQHR